MGSAMYADARTFDAFACPAAFPVPAGRRLRLSGRLTLSGVRWSAGEA
jgi:hypothetical protein